MAIRVIDDSKLQDIAVAIQDKDGGGQMTVDEMPGRIENIPSGEFGVANPALILMDWEGTVLKRYAASDVAALTELPDPASLPLYENADHELLSFQNWNWSIEDIKAWVQNHAGHALTVGAIYTTTDSQDHNYWRSPRLSENSQIYMQHRATTSIGNSVFYYYFSLTSISLPDGLTSIGDSAFYYCFSLTSISLPNSLTSIGDSAFYYCCSLTSISLSNSLTSIGNSAFGSCRSLSKIDIPASVTRIGDNAFNYCTSLVDVVIRGTPALDGSAVFRNNPSNQRFYVHRSDLSWFSTATNWSAIYRAGKIVAAADYIEYLQSIGIDTTDFEGE